MLPGKIVNYWLLFSLWMHQDILHIDKFWKK
jgi:hypothetical protein